MKILMLLGIIILSFNVARFGIGAINYLLNEKKKEWLIIGNFIEASAIITTLVILIISYYSK